MPDEFATPTHHLFKGFPRFPVDVGTRKEPPFAPSDLTALRWTSCFQRRRCVGHTGEGMTKRGLIMCAQCGHYDLVVRGPCSTAVIFHFAPGSRLMWWITNRTDGVSALGWLQLLGLGRSGDLWACLVGSGCQAAWNRRDLWRSCPCRRRAQVDDRGISGLPAPNPRPVRPKPPGIYNRNHRAGSECGHGWVGR